jgi:hypothetical protein
MKTEINVSIEANGRTFTARVTAENEISICCDGVWAGNGRWDNSITDCDAHLGEGVYEALGDAISEEMDNYVVSTDADTMTVTAMSPDHAAVVYARICCIADIESVDDLANHFASREGWVSINLKP